MEGRENSTPVANGRGNKRKSSDLDQSVVITGNTDGTDKRRLGDRRQGYIPPQQEPHRTSELLAKEYWPIGYSKEDVDKLTFDMAVKLRSYQDKQERNELHS